MTEEPRRSRTRSEDPGPRLVRAVPSVPGYEIVGVIAQGASGTVYRARQLAVEREVALKVLHADAAQGGRLVKRLQREARTTARLAHPHIVSAIDMGQSDGRWWFAMEFVDGPSLALALRQSGRLSEREALRLFIPLCEALVHLSDHGVVHRDIKPANVLLDASGTARLADLGLAFTGDDPVLTAHGGTLGTPHYISPEQARDPSSVDGRADIWSFGATLFHAVCGRPPFGGDSLAEVLAGVLHSRIPDPAALRHQLSRGFALVLRKCLSRDLALRYASPRELLADLERVRERRPPDIDARSLEPVEGRRSPWRPLVISAVVLLGVAVPAVLFWPRQDEGPTAATGPRLAAPELDEGVRELYQSARQDPTRLATALFELEAYGRTVPAALAPAVADMVSKLQADLRRELRALQGEVEARLARRLESGDYVEARRLVEGALDQSLRARTGFSAAELPPATAAAQARWREEHRAEVERATRSGIEVLRAAAEKRYATFVLPDVERLVSDRAFGSAMEALSRDPRRLVRDAGLEVEGVPSELLDEALAPLRARVNVQKDLLVDAWARVDADLVRWVARRADTLEEELRARRVVDAARELEESFAAKLATELASADEILAPESAAVLRELERRRQALADLEDRLVADEIEDKVALFQEVFRSLWVQRDYPTLLFVWRDLREEVTALPGDRDRAWRERAVRRITLALREAEILDGLLDDAADRLVELDGTEHELRLGSILLRGRLDLRGDPREEPFRLHVSGTVHEVSLRELASRDLLALLDDGEPPTPRDRLVRALLFFRDGNVDRALSELRSGPLPADATGDGGGALAIDAELAADLKERAITSLEERRAEVRDRERAARELLGLVDAARPGTYRLSAIERLLDEYGDLDAVRGRAKDLRALRDELRSPRPRPTALDFERAFAATAVELSRHRVRLVFDFDASGSGAWDSADWTRSAEGWSPPPAGRDEVELWSTLEQTGGPRLALRKRSAEVLPEDELDLRIDLDVPRPPRVLLVSGAGFHVSLSGPGLAGGGRAEATWLATAGTLAEHVELLRAGRGNAAPALAAGTHRIQLVLRPRAGRVGLTVDGVPIDTVSVRAPRESAATHEVVLRSLDALVLRRVEVEGDLER